MPSTAYALLGPTASGKSRLALALAARFPVEIVVMDSAQVYRGMDIGTAKPGAAERARVPHHLIDLVNPDAGYSAGSWRVDCLEVIAGIFKRKRLPLLVGGTMLYYRTLVSGLDVLPAADPAIRSALDEQAKRLGWPAMHAELAGVDPVAAGRIAPNDAQRIQRALEVFRLAGQPLSALQGRSKESLPFALSAFALVLEKQILDQKIAQRFDAMLQAGLIDEVRTLKNKYRLTGDSPSMRAVGYRQVWDFLEKHTNDNELRERAIAATRQLAKRQLTWLRSFRQIKPADHLESALMAGSKSCK
ncbi:MAG TPA: tRNA (adenosine(37)-N6)-dimethylallyltransferase MiaA [Burkholderiales bacterium]